MVFSLFSIFEQKTYACRIEHRRHILRKVVPFNREPVNSGNASAAIIIQEMNHIAAYMIISIIIQIADQEFQSVSVVFIENEDRFLAEFDVFQRPLIDRPEALLRALQPYCTY